MENAMSLKDTVQETTSCVLVEGPRWGDAEFYGRWLLAIANAEALWKEARNDPDFAKQIESVTVCLMPDFGIGATVMLSQLEKKLASITIGLNDASGIAFDEFAMMAEMGFFVLSGERYQMAIPTNLDSEKLKKAVRTFAQTEDEEGILHPEHLVTTMPYTRAHEWQASLRQMDEDQRCADRFPLLDGSSDRLPAWEPPQVDH
jgi:hypothetical protein